MKFVQYQQVNCTISFFFSFSSFSIHVKEGYGKRLLDDYCGPIEGAFLTSTLNVSVEVEASNKYSTFTARYAILNGSIDKGKAFQYRRRCLQELFIFGPFWLYGGYFEFYCLK